MIFKKGKMVVPGPEEKALGMNSNTAEKANAAINMSRLALYIYFVAQAEDGI